MVKHGVKLGVVYDGDQMLVVRASPEPYMGVAPTIAFAPPIPMDAEVEGRPICAGFIRHLMLFGRKGVDALLKAEGIESKSFFACTVCPSLINTG